MCRLQEVIIGFCLITFLAMRGTEASNNIHEQQLRYILEHCGARNATQLDSMSVDDMSNTLKVELAKTQGVTPEEFDKLTTFHETYMYLCLEGKLDIAQVLSRCGIRSQTELGFMSTADQINTLKVEVAKTQQITPEQLLDTTTFQETYMYMCLKGGVNPAEALLRCGIRTGPELDAMSDMDKLNTWKVEVAKTQGTTPDQLATMTTFQETPMYLCLANRGPKP